ncbi:MAG: hypothetical protein A2161_08035 [Candidatus Schekmanbacteria bacterium RBG_13_48_7]|uniref:Right handed beta helix domain-containing protein n=1 Tax=Candidatus Schekmanbacteria bacterium RBG_13_48_7 TaxID=1817878 RepID=A0A1F7RQG4_9BACT|nr:MAG: hypothetical protein A2161_08035 [Candidatus Schekmanbacteria bacterium RBG_13_48_7]
MIHGDMAAGIYLMFAPGAEVYFNSIYNTYTSTGYGIYVDSPNSIDVPSAIMNNVVFNDGSDTYTAIYISKLSELPVSMDYNDWYDNDIYFGKVWGTDYSSMAVWRTDTGRDAYSRTANPLFTAVSDLHINGTSPCRSAGYSIASITVDIDGDIRNVPPDMGADEYFVLSPTPTLTPTGTWYTATPTHTPVPVPSTCAGGFLMLVLIMSVALLVKNVISGIKNKPSHIV